MERMTRHDVYKLIDSERAYQEDYLTKERTDGNPKNLGEYLPLLRVILRNAEDNFYGLPGNHPDTLSEIRKLAATAVRCLEEHGAPPRTVKTIVVKEIPLSEKDKEELSIGE